MIRAWTALPATSAPNTVDSAARTVTHTLEGAMDVTTLSLLVAVLSLVVAAGFVAAVWWVGPRTGATALRATLATGAWLAITGVAAAKGILHFEPPPTMAVVMVALVVIAIWIAHSSLGGRLAHGLPLAVLVGYQVFRVGVELLIHQAHTQGLLPIQMTYSGFNFDIVSGVTGGILGAVLLARSVPRWVLLGWNVLGLALLVIVVSIAMLSAPTPLRVWHDDPSTTLVTGFPWVWLPAILVLAALVGHLLLFRRLRATG